MNWEQLKECCSSCCYNQAKKKKEVPYKTPKEALASVATPEMLGGLPMAKSVHLQQPSDEKHHTPQTSSDVMVITQQPKFDDSPPLFGLSSSHQTPLSVSSFATKAGSSRRSRSPSSTSSTSDAPPIFPVHTPPVSAFETLRPSEPSLQLAITYYPDKQHLCVHSVAYQLLTQHQQQPAGSREDGFEDAETFLVLQVHPSSVAKVQSKFRRGVEARSLSDEVFVFPEVPAVEVRYKTITVHVYRRLNSGQNQLMGEVAYPLSEADITGTLTILPIKLSEQTSQVDEKPAILLSLGYNASERKLHGIVLRGRGLHLPPTSSFECVSAVVLMKDPERKGSKKWQSSSVHSGTTPVFNQKFNFHLTPSSQLENVEVTVVLVSCSASGARGDPLGMVQMGSSVSSAGAVSIWEGMQQSSISLENKPVSGWLELTPCKASAAPETDSVPTPPTLTTLDL